MPKEIKNKDNTAKKNKAKKHFFKDTKAELKKVIWPTSKQLVNNTVAVVVIVLVIGIIVFALDVCFEKMNSLGVNKLKELVQTENTVSNETTTSNSENTSEVNETTAEDSANTSTDATTEETATGETTEVAE